MNEEDIGQLHWSKAKQKYWIMYKDGTWEWIRQWYEQSRLSADREHFILHDYIHIQKQQSIHSEPPSKKSKIKTNLNINLLLTIGFFIATLILTQFGDPLGIIAITFTLAGFFLIIYLIDVLDVDLSWDNGDD